MFRTALIVAGAIAQFVDRFLKDPADAAACLQFLTSLFKKR
jgi:hypothetical protein